MSQHFNKQISAAKKRNNKKKSSKKQSYRNEQATHYDNHQINYNSADENVSCASEAEITPIELIGIQFSEYSLYRKPQFSLKYVSPLGEQPTLLGDNNRTSRYTSSFIFRDFSLFI